MLALESASDVCVESIANWFDMKKPTTKMESHFLDKRSDLVSLAGGQSSKEFLEQYLERNWFHLFRIKVRILDGNARSLTRLCSAGERRLLSQLECRILFYGQDQAHSTNISCSCISDIC